MGLVWMAVSVDAVLCAIHPLSAEALAGVPAGLIWVFGGALLALPPGRTRWQGLLATLLITCFALTADWVAFGPGERRFSGSVFQG